VCLDTSIPETVTKEDRHNDYLVWKQIFSSQALYKEYLIEEQILMKVMQ